VWRAFLEAHAAVADALDAELRAERGMPLTWYDVLVNLHEAGGRLRMQHLASAVLFSRSGLTRLVDRMGSAGLVRRERCADDGRGTFAVMTPAGRRALQRAAPVHLRGVDEHFLRHLGPADLRAFDSALGRVLASSDRTGARGESA
jgi:DNA-binding MarR family transcriptional regulator